MDSGISNVHLKPWHLYATGESLHSRAQAGVGGRRGKGQGTGSCWGASLILYFVASFTGDWPGPLEGTECSWERRIQGKPSFSSCFLLVTLVSSGGKASQEARGVKEKEKWGGWWAGGQYWKRPSDNFYTLTFFPVRNWRSQSQVWNRSWLDSVLETRNIKQVLCCSRYHTAFVFPVLM